MSTHHMFTFGPDHAPVENAVVLVHGATYEQARGIMVALFGTAWSSQYSGDEILEYRAKYPTTTYRVVKVGHQ
jgi:hypothetical protein